MKKSLQWIFLIVVALLVLGLVALEVATNVTEAQRAKAVASVEKPEAVRFHEQLAAEASRISKTSSSGISPEATTAASLSPHEIIARWARLFERVRVLMDEDGEWAEYWLVNDTKKPDEKTLEDWRLTLKWKAERRSVAQEIRAMAVIGGPVIVLDFSWEGHAAFEQHLADLRRCVVVLTGRYLDLAIEKGRYADAAEDFLATMKLADLLAAEPYFDSQVSRRKFYSWICDDAALVFARIELPPELSAELLARLAKADARESLTHALAAQRYFHVEYRKEWRETSLTAWVEEHGAWMGGRNWLWMSPLCAPWSNTDESTSLEYMHRLQVLADKPYCEVKPQLDAIAAEALGLSIMKDATKRVVPDNLEAFAEQAEIETLIDLTQLGLLLGAHYAEHGVFPDSLEAIAAWLGGELPVDPFSGEGYRYRPDKDSFLLYGVGPDCMDNDGTPREGEGATGGPGDIVWPRWTYKEPCS